MEDAKRKIREHIYAGGGGAGTFSEREIADRFGVKRNHAREVLLALVGEGVIVGIPLVGYRYVDFGGTDPETLDAVRGTVEGEAVKKAVSQATREELVRLTLIFDELEEAYRADDYARYNLADLDFHREVVAASHDNMLIGVFRYLATVLFRLNPDRIHSDSLEATHREHRELFSAIRAKDAAQAAAVIHRHHITR